MFTTFIVQPIFNLLVLIYALLPGHNFGLAIIIFTIVVRMAMWPLVKRQLHHVKDMRKLQPELKAIKKKAAGNRQKEQIMVLELYKERGISPFGPIMVLIPQFLILIGLYSGLNKVIHHPEQIVNFAYPVLQHMGWMQELAKNIGQFDETLFGFVDLTRSATGSGNGIYWPAFIIVVLTAIVQYYQSKQVLPNNKDARKLRDILKSSSEGQQADQAEVQAAVSRSTLFLLPGIIFIVTLGLPAALGLYWLTGGIVAIIQQSIILREDEEELEAIANAPDKKRDVKAIPEAEVVSTPVKTKTKKSSTSKKKRRKKR